MRQRMPARRKPICSREPIRDLVSQAIMEKLREKITEKLSPPCRLEQRPKRVEIPRTANAESGEAAVAVVAGAGMAAAMAVIAEQNEAPNEAPNEARNEV
jgi:hypothetical protein